jgi:hypothetical protein
MPQRAHPLRPGASLVSRGRLQIGIVSALALAAGYGGTIWWTFGRSTPPRNVSEPPPTSVDDEYQPPRSTGLTATRSPAAPQALEPQPTPIADPGADPQPDSDDKGSHMHEATKDLHVTALRQARQCIHENPNELPALLLYRWRIVVGGRVATVLDPEFVQTKLGAPPRQSFLDCLQRRLPRQTAVPLARSFRPHETARELLIPTRLTSEEGGMKSLLQELQQSAEAGSAH